jgi:cell division protein FtsW
VLVLFLAYFLQTRIHAMDDWKGTVLRAALPPLVFIALILKEPDLGTALVCALVTALMLYLAGAQVKYFLIAAAVASPVLYYMLFHVAFRKARMLAFINPELDPKGAGFHILQSLIAVGTGGMTGLGLMESVQKLFYLPEPHTDFIFAVVCEELGWLGAIAVLALFVTLGYRGLRAAVLSTDPFARFLAFGITSTILIQAFFNMSVVLALLPTKGIPLPLISSGGTSVFLTLASLGILLNVTKAID